MGSQKHYSEIPCELISEIKKLYGRILKLESLKPSEQLKSLFSQLRELCMRPSHLSIDIDAFSSLPQDVQSMRHHLIELTARAESLLEHDFATRLLRQHQSQSEPHRHSIGLNKLISDYPYIDQYVVISALENKILSDNGVVNPKTVAFIGSGPMPLSCLILARHHMTATNFDLFDVDEEANDVARRLVSCDVELTRRVKFHTQDILTAGETLLQQYDCIFLACLVGIKRVDKVKVIEHLRKNMKGGSVLILRSATGALSFLYPLIQACDLVGFQVLTRFRATDVPPYSIFLVRKPMTTTTSSPLLVSNGKKNTTVSMPQEVTMPAHVTFPVV